VHATAQKFERMVERYRDTYQQLGARVEDLPATAPDSEALKTAARNARDTAEDWWKVELEARQFLDGDPDMAERIYQQGVDRLEDARLYCNFAIFLHRHRKDGQQAEKYFRRALEMEPDRASIYGNYANFLSDFCKDLDGAEENYKRAFEIEPDNPHTLGNYGVFLADCRDDPERAEAYLKRALALDSDHPNNLSNYATILTDVHNDFARAEKYFQQALELEPNSKDILGNYGRLLLEQGRTTKGGR
jgi:Tfp pilus assembly protein PilF